MRLALFSTSDELGFPSSIQYNIVKVGIWIGIVTITVVFIIVNTSIYVFGLWNLDFQSLHHGYN